MRIEKNAQAGWLGRFLLKTVVAANGNNEPMLPRFCSAANVCQSVRHEEEEIDDPLNVDLRLAQFKQVMV